jgi:uncharacterized repeat protein (TIGR01451 family)
MPGGTGLAAGTMEPTRVAAPISAASLPPLVEPAGKLVAEPLIVTGSDLPTADLAIQVIPGEAGLYTLTVHNFGPDPANSVVITDVLPSGVTLLWTGPTQPVCSRQERGVGCDLGALQAGEAATVTLDLSVGGAEAPISGTQLAGVTVTLSVPSCTLDQDWSPRQVTCRLNRLGTGAEAQVRVGIGMEGPATGALAHTATVTAQEIDPNGTNNRVTSPLAAGVAALPTATPVSPTADLVIQADGPGIVTAGQSFTYTYIITNRGAAEATDVWFEDTVPSDMNLVGYAPGLPACEQQGARSTCYLRDPDSGETVTLTLVITEHGGQPMLMGLDPLLPGWPICTVLKERTWLQIIRCQLGDLQPAQVTCVQLIFEAIGVLQRTTVNTAAVRANKVGPNPVVSTSTVTITVQTGAEPDRP